MNAWALRTLVVVAAVACPVARAVEPASAPEAAAPSSPPAASASAPAPSPSGGPLPGAPTSPAESNASGARRGAIVVLVGPNSDKSTEDCRTLARGIYRSPDLRPSSSEEQVRVLCGESPTETTKPLSELRGSLTTDTQNAGGKALLAAIADETQARWVVELATVATPESAVTRVRWADFGSLPPRYDPVTFEWAASGSSDWNAVAEAIALFTAEPPAPSDVPLGPRTVPGLGPKLLFPDPPAAPAEAPSFFESPWFWVAAGGVAALGVTILVVSATTEVGVGQVIVGGHVDRGEP